MTLKAALAQDALAILNAEEFAEVITYTPHGGSPKAINAIVTRDPSRVRATTGARPVPIQVREIVIANHATAGVTAVKERFDTVSFKLNLDDPTPTTLTVTKILTQDEGAWHLEVQA